MNTEMSNRRRAQAKHHLDKLHNLRIEATRKHHELFGKPGEEQAILDVLAAHEKYELAIAKYSRLGFKVRNHIGKVTD
jgi:hypothetical protein